MDKSVVPVNRQLQDKSLLAAVLLIFASFAVLNTYYISDWQILDNVPFDAPEIIQKCHALNALPAPPRNFHQRSHSDRFVDGTPPTLFRNASIWTGRDSGNEVVAGDLLIDNGLIKAIGFIEETSLAEYKNLVVIDAEGAWITPGIVDLHSHLGVDSSPYLRGSDDTNSLKGLVLPWLRSLDGLNTHDEAYELSISGGVTTANVLPGSADAIGGQAFTIKLRPTAERSSSSMLLEPLYSLNGTNIDSSLPPRWRQMKHACGENPSRVYSGTRMDTIWAFREGYNTALKIKKQQDEYCGHALGGRWKNIGKFPEDLQWEALVDVLRGRVKVHIHCYEATDIDGMVRLTNEFKFSIAAFHHAHEAYLVPDLLKKAYGPTPAVAMFATNARYKREAYRGSEFAPRILAENGVRVVLKSDHPVLNSRHLLFEAQQAHYYGLPHNLALASVTSTSAAVLGYDHRIGYIKLGYDADIVLWDSHPLALGATPKQVFIDGIAQITTPYVNPKPASFQILPKTPDFSKEAENALKYEGLPPLVPMRSNSDLVIFTNVSSVFLKHDDGIREAFTASEASVSGNVVVEKGEIVCMGDASTCSVTMYDSKIQHVDLMGGSISPALISYGSPLGLNHIDGEPSTNDGYVYDPLKSNPPEIIGEGSIIKAVDGLQFQTRDALLAYRFGVTTGITAPSSKGFLAGLSTAFNTGQLHRLAKGAVVQDIAALHVSIDSSKPSVSTQIAALRNLLQGGGKGELAARFEDVVQGKLPLVIEVHSADIMASLINLKKEIETEHKTLLRITFSGASEAHILAKEIGAAKVGVILNPARPFPATWKSRRILAGPPLTMHSAVSLLSAHNVTVGLGIQEQWSSRNLHFDVAWAAYEANGTFSRREAYALASVNLERLLGIKVSNRDLVAVKHGDLLGFEGEVISIISPQRETVDLMQ